MHKLALPVEGAIVPKNAGPAFLWVKRQPVKE